MNPENLKTTALKLYSKMKKISFVFALILLLQSCYSVRITCKDCIPEKSATMQGDGFYRDKKATTLKVTQKLSFTETTRSQYVLDSAACPNGFYSIEYKTTLGHVFLSGITFGRIRKVRVIYICQKETN
ncbi:MAG: hypothetical protein ACK5PC_17560 [Cyclobacteriaceae bacterium]|jgi:hypothetical protein